MGIDLSIVHKITSLEDLKNLVQALDQTATFQAKIQLEAEIRRLAKRRDKLRVEITALEMERDGLQPPPNEKATTLKEDAEDEEEQRPRSTLEADSRRLIEEITEEPAEEQEVPQDVESNTDLPEA